MSRLQTVEELRERYAEKTPLFHVEYLPYLDFFDRYPGRRPPGYGYGSLDDIYTSRVEAEKRFAELRGSGLIEKMELWETLYPKTGGRARRLLNEWNDEPSRDRARSRSKRNPKRSSRDAASVRSYVPGYPGFFVEYRRIAPNRYEYNVHRLNQNRSFGSGTVASAGAVMRAAKDHLRTRGSPRRDPQVKRPRRVYQIRIYDRHGAHFTTDHALTKEGAREKARRYRSEGHSKVEIMPESRYSKTTASRQRRFKKSGEQLAKYYEGQFGDSPAEARHRVKAVRGRDPRRARRRS